MEAGESLAAWQYQNEPSEAGPETAVAATVDEASEQAGVKQRGPRRDMSLSLDFILGTTERQ